MGYVSLSCDSCRKRRIKCDRLEEGCSQCRRIQKPCPGYRDPLEVMFRDESSKVIRKAQGNTSKSRSRRAAPSTKGESSGSSPCSSFSADGDRSPGVPTEAGTETIEPAGPAPAAAGYGSCAVGISRQRALELVPKGAPDVVRYREVCQTPEEMGKAFYIQNYVLRHAGEPKSAIELAEVEWIKHDSMQHIIVGIGLAGMTNLTSNPELRRVALEKRGMTLELLRRSLQVPGSLEYELSVRNIILLAQFELVFGAPLSVAAANSHVAGCAAILRDQIPVNPLSALGLMDLLYCMFITCHEMAQAVPEQALRILGQCKLLARQGVPLLAELTELAGLIARFIDLSITKRTRVYEDGTRETGALVQAFVDLDADLAGWEARLGTWWTFFTRKCVSPPQAVFQGRAHCYGSMLIGRTWNHYRWARILVNQVLFDLKARYPLSAELILSGEAEWDRVALVKSLAEDILASTPFHYRHPNLSDEDLGAMETERRQGAGSAGVSVLLFHLKVAGSVSKELWDWAFEIARTIWGTMGTKIASSIMEDMISGRDGLLKAGIYQDFGTEAGLGVGLGAC